MWTPELVNATFAHEAPSTQSAGVGIASIGFADFANIDSFRAASQHFVNLSAGGKQAVADLKRK